MFARNGRLLRVVAPCRNFSKRNFFRGIFPLQNTVQDVPVILPHNSTTKEECQSHLEEYILQRRNCTESIYQLLIDLEHLAPREKEEHLQQLLYISVQHDDKELFNAVFAISWTRD